MATFEVTIKREIRISATVEVEAETEEQAIELAVEESHSWVDSDWQCDNVPNDWVSKVREVSP